MCDVDTQDILGNVRSATQLGQEDNTFFLLVSTPNNPHRKLHKNIIQPFLRHRGWKKVNHRSTGFRALYFLHDEEPEMEEDLACCLTQEFTCYRCSNPPKETPTSSKTPKKRKLNICNRDGNKLASSSDLSSVNSINKLPPFCESCSSLTPTQRAARDRNELKKSVECFKSEVNGVFNVHIVLSRPVDYEEDFVDMASQPNAIDQDFL